MSEVEDEDNKIILKNFDINRIFIKKNNKYYEFKPEVKSKEQISEILRSDNKSVINLFEKWFEKYALSLSKLNRDEEESEKIMKKYLKEINYEY
jgi:type I restriction enzyme M protein